MAKNGIYRIAYTYAEYNAAGTMVYETGRSPTRTYTISGTQSVSGVYTDDARINRIRIYSTLASGTVYYLEKVITNTTGTARWWTNLSMDDATLGVQATAYWTNKGYETKRLFVSGVFPPHRYVTHAAGRLWFCGRMQRSGTNEDASVSWSELAPNYEDVPVSNTNTTFAEPTTGLYEWNELVYVFTRHSRWRITPADYNEAMEFDKLESEVGCAGGHTIAKMESAVIWLHDRGFYLTVGDSEPVLVSGSIEDTIQSLDRNRMAFAVAENFPEDHEYECWCSLKGGKLNDICLVYDYSRGLDSGRWTVRGGLGRTVFYVRRLVAADGSRYKLYGDHMGNVWQDGIGTSDGANEGGTYQGTLDTTTTTTTSTTTTTTSTTT